MKSFETQKHLHPIKGEDKQEEEKKVVTAEIETLFCATIWYQSFCSHDKYKIKNKRGGSQIV